MTLPALHVLVSDEAAGRPDFRTIVGGMRSDLGHGLALHLRCRTMTAAELFDIASSLVSDADRHGGWCVVNGRLDVALAAGCQAVQLGRGALRVSDAVGLAGGRCLVGASVHDAPEADGAARSGANYVVSGTVYPSASHPGAGAAGPDLVRDCVRAGVPVIAIGGITTRTVPEVVSCGAVGVAVISAVWRDPDPRGAAGRLSEALAATLGGS